MWTNNNGNWQVSTGNIYVNNVFANSFTGKQQTLTSAAAISPDFAYGDTMICTLTHDPTIAVVSNINNGARGIMVYTASGADRTITWNASYEISGGNHSTLIPSGTKTTVYFWRVDDVVQLSIHGDMS